jgi:hypothetical protein
MFHTHRSGGSFVGGKKKTNAITVCMIWNKQFSSWDNYKDKEQIM